jgi:hypothetical protein
MAARNTHQASSGTGEQRACARDAWCEARTRDAEGAWHPALAYQPYCVTCSSRIVSCAAELPESYAYLHAGGAPARSGRPVRVAPGSRVLVNPAADALLRVIAAQTAGWASRVRSVPGISRTPSRNPHGTPERVRDDCLVLTLYPSALFALTEGPTARAYPWPLAAEEEKRLADCEIVRIGDDWVHVVEQLDGTVAGTEILDLHHRVRKLAGRIPAPPDLLDGIPCRSCEAMSSLEVIPAPPPDPQAPPGPFCRCSVPGCKDEMTRREYDDWVRQYDAWVKGSGILTCRRCYLDEHGSCQWRQCACRASGHRIAA